MIRLVATFTMKQGKVEGALDLVAACKRQSEREQPGTLVYLVHRVLDKDSKPTRELLFHEEYADQAALTAHMNSSSWKKIEAEWTTWFEGPSSEKGIKVQFLDRIAAFARPGAIPIAPAPED